ncbi:MAG: GntR family transcriptional regulator, partial [Mesorhizobium sp.]
TRSLPSEPELGTLLGVSRTTVRTILARMEETGLIDWNKRSKTVLREPRPDDFFPEEETDTLAEIIERSFMRRLLASGAEAGMQINELELAREIGVGTTSVREFLIRFSRFGLIEKRPNTGWLFKGFTEDFALELFEIRVMFELRSAQLFSLQPDSSPLWSKLAALKMAHTDLLERIEGRFHDFSGLDNRFHRLINEASQNRFIDDFYDIITFIFHYHYQWNKHDEKQRNLAAIHEHIAYIGALESRNSTRIEVACRAHLASARETLMRSLTAFDESSINA